MEGVSIVTIGDSTTDRFLEVENQNATLLFTHRETEKDICFKFGEKIPVSDIHKGFGGSALNTAVGFSRLGIKTSIVTILGKDEEGNDALEFLKKNGVETVNSIQEEQTNQSTIIVYKNERTVLSYQAERDYSKLEIPKTDWLYLTSAGKGADEIIKKVQAHMSTGTKVCFNPGNWELLNFDKFTEIISGCEVLILNKFEADDIFSNNEIANQLEKISERRAKIAIITDARNGAYLRSEGKNYHMGILPSETIDPTGAGDSFSSGFISGLIYGVRPESAMKWGMANAASVVESVGANEGLLDKEKISNIIEEAASLKAEEI